MALPARRSYAGAAEACTLTSNISNSATSFSITGTTTAWPSTATGPFYMVIDPGLSTEEKVLVGARTTGSLSSVTRGVDGTAAAAHDAGATCYPVLAAVDLNEANLLASTLTTKGDLLSTDGSDPKRVAVGSNNTRLVADSAQTSGIKWVADTQNTVIDAKGDLLVGSAADTVARLAVGADNTLLVAASGETTGTKWSTLASLGGGAWTSYTPTLKQGTTTVTATVNYAKYMRIQSTVWVQVQLSVTGAGPGNQAINISLPSGIVPPTQGNTRIIGGMEILDSGTAFYFTSAICETDLIKGLAYNTPDYAGAQNPGFTFANGDAVGFQVCYEVA